MKRDIEWAKKEIERLDTEESQYYPHNEMIEQEAVLGILNQLDKSVVYSESDSKILLQLKKIKQDIEDFVDTFSD